MKQKIISICGAHSSCGKTTVAENLLKHLDGSWGAIKFTKTAFYTSVKQESSKEAPEGKDTYRLLQAGADEVVHIQSPDSGLEEPLNMAMGMLSAYEGLLVEGNSPIEFLKPDVVIFVFGKEKSRVKPSALKVLNQADIILFHGSEPSILASSGKELQNRLDINDKGAIERLKSLLDETIESAAGLEEKLKGLAESQKLSCSRARRLAEEEDVSYSFVGRCADRLGIKITGCELGCF